MYIYKYIYICMYNMYLINALTFNSFTDSWTKINDIKDIFVEVVMYQKVSYIV